MSIVIRHYRTGEGQAMHLAYSELLDWLYENLGPRTNETSAIYRWNSEGTGPCEDWMTIKQMYYQVRGVPDFNDHLSNIILEWSDDWWVSQATMWDQKLTFEIAIQVPDDLIATQLKLAFLC